MKCELCKISSTFCNVPDSIAFFPEVGANADISDNLAPTEWYACKLPDNRVAFDENGNPVVDGVVCEGMLSGTRLYLIDALTKEKKLYVRANRI